jgi:hypothetical protein
MGNAIRSLKIALTSLANANPGQGQTFLELSMAEMRDAIAGLEGMRVAR